MDDRVCRRSIGPWLENGAPIRGPALLVHLRLLRTVLARVRTEVALSVEQAHVEEILEYMRQHGEKTTRGGTDFLSASEINGWRYPYTRPHLPTPVAEVAEGSVVLDPRMPTPAQVETAADP